MSQNHLELHTARRKLDDRPPVILHYGLHSDGVTDVMVGRKQK
jgi:hypothetical protein